MAEPMPYLGNGVLGAALSALQNRPGQLNQQVDAASGGAPMQAPPVPTAPLSPQQQALQYLQNAPGLSHPGVRPMVNPQQQAQLVQLLRARMAAQQGQPGQQPMPQQPAPAVPMMQNAAPIPGMSP